MAQVRDSKADDVNITPTEGPNMGQRDRESVGRFDEYQMSAVSCQPRKHSSIIRKTLTSLECYTGIAFNCLPISSTDTTINCMISADGVSYPSTGGHVYSYTSGFGACILPLQLAITER